jgi:NAD(P)-dependent dehydrogenase (short-subunit alcohol dehydrogenase family)
MATKLAGKIALVTGGSSGLGLATATRFIDEGAKVVVTGRRQTELDIAVKELGRSALGVRGDVSNLSDLDRLYDTIRERYGRLDIVFANAGGGAFVALGEITEEHIDKYFDINVKGTLFSETNSDLFV